MRDTHADDAAVVAEDARKPRESQGFAASTVQQDMSDTDFWNPGDSSITRPVLDTAKRLGIEPKRLRGFILRNGLGDPIGDMENVYPWSCAALRKRLAATASEVQP